MPNWVAYNINSLGPTMVWMLKNDILLYFSAGMYALFAYGLWKLGTIYHGAIVRKDPGVGQFPPGYFVMMAVQLVPLAITGFVIGDDYLILTRVGTLAIVLAVFVMSKSKDGTFDSPEFRRGIGLAIIICMVIPMIWARMPLLRTFVHDYEKWISWVAIGTMFAFVIGGQWATAKTLFKHYMEGNYSSKRFRLQVIRFFCFAPQAVHYFFVPTTAQPFFGIDAVFLNAFMGTVGVIIVLLTSAYGWLLGSRERHNRLREAHLLSV